jgi:hypothetical protein
MYDGHVINIYALHKIDKPLLYAYLYGSRKGLIERIDEEGCGAVFAELFAQGKYF